MADIEVTPVERGSGTHKLKLSKRIGRGAFGDVYKGTFDGEVCAIKTIPASAESLDVVYQMYTREARVLCNCDHSRIIGFKALVRVNSSKAGKHGHQKGGRWALVLEYAKGGSLSNTVVKQMISPGSRVYTMAQALQWALDIASGLDYLHSRTPMILHRDVKLSNVLLVKEDKKLVAKLSDFGLHVAADKSVNQFFRVGFSPGPNTQRSFHCMPMSGSAATKAAATTNDNPAVALQDKTLAQKSCSVCNGADVSCGHDSSVGATGGQGGRTSVTLTQEHLQVLQQQLQKAPDTQCVCSNKEAPAMQQQEAQGGMWRAASAPIGCSRAGCIADKQYTEIHDAAGVTTFVGSPAMKTLMSSTGLDRRLKTTVAPKSAAAVGMAPYSSTCQSAAAQGGQPLEQSISVELAHGGLKQEQLNGPDTGAPADLGVAGGADSAVWFVETGSMCSMVTDATWLTDGTALVDPGAAADKSWHGSSDGSSCVTEVETVFDMTGQTGSFMYMSPEVFLGEPYNEKADVFSFGIVLYELLAQCLLIFTELPTTTNNPEITEWYARKVAEGYRPAKPKRLQSNLWNLIQACWQQEPKDRPSMKQVVASLEDLLAQETGLSVAPHRPGAAGHPNAHHGGDEVMVAAAGRIACRSQQNGVIKNKACDKVEGPHAPALNCGCVIC